MKTLKAISSIQEQYMLTDLQDEYIKQAAEKVAKDIDFHVLSEMLISSGWTKIEISYTPGIRSWVSVKEWVEQNCSKQHTEHMGIWLFKNKKDAIMFALKWS